MVKDEKLKKSKRKANQESKRFLEMKPDNPEVVKTEMIGIISDHLELEKILTVANDEDSRKKLNTLKKGCDKFIEASIQLEKIGVDILGFSPNQYQRILGDVILVKWMALNALSPFQESSKVGRKPDIQKRRFIQKIAALWEKEMKKKASIYNDRKWSWDCYRGDFFDTVYKLYVDLTGKEQSADGFGKVIQNTLSELHKKKSK